MRRPSSSAERSGSCGSDCSGSTLTTADGSNNSASRIELFESDYHAHIRPTETAPGQSNRSRSQWRVYSDHASRGPGRGDHGELGSTELVRSAGAVDRAGEGAPDRRGDQSIEAVGAEHHSRG